MKRFVVLFSVITLMLASFADTVDYPRGDVDHSGAVNIADVTTLIDYLLDGLWPEDLPYVPQTETFTVNGVSFTMVKVIGGMFMMGGTDEQGSDAEDWEKPAHPVILSPYSIGRTEVTQELWQAVMGTNPSTFTGDPKRPVECVSYPDCKNFITKLNELTGMTFRLPTEAEWEFAARGGNWSKGYKYAGSDSIGNVAWCWNTIPSQTSGTEGYGTQGVASLAPNELGLYDMSGNVWEWCQDWYGNYTGSEQTNPTGPSYGMFRIMRGGSWNRSAVACRVSYRNYNYPNTADDGIGLRLAL